ncbi:MAG: transcriptional regulator, partial [Muribaculaceae bacterium]|nr:transcriptional regulator [Muribaculaceae bacterium]
TYTFEVVAEMSDGSTIGDRIEFKVLPPWYRSSAFIAVYMLLVLGLIAVGYLMYRKRMIRLERAITAEGEQKLLSQQTVFEQEMQQKESEIEEMRRQKMQSELDHKSQEVVNLLLTLSRSRETMLGLKEELFRLSQAVGGNSEARKIITLLHGKINANMESDTIMERIEKEFDIVNDGMIKKLRKTYPSLSSNEVLMCAYLRMNLSSKEIAPLLNLSLRGVETMRYRLRKKFGLDRDVSITDFIMSL